MKRIILIVGAILLVANGLFGLLLSGYEQFNLIYTSLVIVVTTALLSLLCKLEMRKGFVVGLVMLFTIFGIVEYVLGLISPLQLKGNGCIIITIVLTTIEIITLFACNITSKQIKIL